MLYTSYTRPLLCEGSPTNKPTHQRGASPPVSLSSPGAGGGPDAAGLAISVSPWPQRDQKAGLAASVTPQPQHDSDTGLAASVFPQPQCDSGAGQAA